MAKKNGRCTNIGNCDYADRKKIIEILDGQDFKCPECHNELYPSKSETKNGFANNNISKLLKILGVLILVSSVIIIIARVQGKNILQPKWPIIAKVDTTIVYGDVKFNMQKGDTLKNENGKLTLSRFSHVCLSQGGLLNQLRNSNIGIIIGMEEDSRPMYYTENDKKTGFAYDFGKELSHKLGIKNVSTIEASYEELPSKLNKGNAHMVVTGYIKDPEISNVLWSDTYLESGLCLIVRTGSAITDYKQLSNKTVGLFKGDKPTKDWVTQNIKNVKIDDSHMETGWIGNVDNGKWDAVIYDYIYAAAEIRKFPNLRIVQFNIKPVEYSIIIPCNNEDLLSEINKEIAILKKTTFYEKLYKKYFDTDKNSIKVSDLSNYENCYTVKNGESLGTIAQEQLGNSSRYDEIYNLNKDRIASPHLIYIGTKLRMPKK